ncbi:MAG TPA: protein kinase [Polyangia bacterium]|jgi:serine/threonine-protein kinase|nr:protein kinase [Polyangia bacterium]
MAHARDSLAAAPPAAQIPAGTTVGARFRIESLLVADAVSQTYRALDIAQGISAAVRVIPLRVLGAGAATLEADVQKTSGIVHKNLIDVLMVGREADFYFIATELLDGQNLRDFMDGKRRDGDGISVKGACNLISHVANALEKAHAVMPHGGLNPASIWVNKAGRVKVGDLGLTRTLPALARRGAPVGNPDHVYAAPEVLNGGGATPASDVYSMGVILYEVLTGRVPIGPIRPASQLAPDVSPAIDRLIERAMNKVPDARFPTPAEFKRVLTATVTGHELPAAGSGPAQSAAGPTNVRAPGAATSGGQSGSHPTQAPLLATPGPITGGPGEAPRLTLGRAFDVMEAVGGGADDNHEHWLIQKDKLDFGPYSLAQIRSQIERGEISGEHMIVDSDSGARKKVKDFPALKEFTKKAERRLEQQRRAHAERAHESVEKKKSVVTFVVVGSALLAVLGGVGLYVVSRKASEGGKLASREEEREVDAFLKAVKLNFATAHVAKRTAGHRPGGASGGGDAEFNNDANLGDVTKGGGGDETLDDGVIQKVMMGNYRSLVPCILQERHHSAGLSDVNVDFVVRGTGKVSAVKVNGQRNGPFAGCVLSRMQGFGFPKFNGSKTIASWSMSMR